MAGVIDAFQEADKNYAIACDELNQVEKDSKAAQKDLRTQEILLDSVKDKLRCEQKTLDKVKVQRMAEEARLKTLKDELIAARGDLKGIRADLEVAKDLIKQKEELAGRFDRRIEVLQAQLKCDGDISNGLKEECLRRRHELDQILRHKQTLRWTAEHPRVVEVCEKVQGTEERTVSSGTTGWKIPKLASESPQVLAGRLKLTQKTGSEKAKNLPESEVGGYNSGYKYNNYGRHSSRRYNTYYNSHRGKGRWQASGKKSRKSPERKRQIVEEKKAKKDEKADERLKDAVRVVVDEEMEELGEVTIELGPEEIVETTVE